MTINLAACWSGYGCPGMGIDKMWSDSLLIPLLNSDPFQSRRLRQQDVYQHLKMGQMRDYLYSCCFHSGVLGQRVCLHDSDVNLSVKYMSFLAFKGREGRETVYFRVSFPDRQKYQWFGFLFGPKFCIVTIN